VGMFSNRTESLDTLSGRIRESLKPLRPAKVIVYGSCVRGGADQDRDIDLIVVLDSETAPQTYRERMENRLAVRRALDALNQDYALDVLVYTSPEWRRFQEMGSAFSREVVSQGVEL
jgi:predicted nucleotidyltransferase